MEHFFQHVFSQPHQSFFAQFSSHCKRAENLPAKEWILMPNLYYWCLVCVHQMGKFCRNSSVVKDTSQLISFILNKKAHYTVCVWPLKHTPEIHGLTFLAAVMLFKVSCLPALLVSKAVKDIKGARVFHFQGSCKCPYLSIIHTRRSKSHCWHLLYITWYLGKASRKSVTRKGPSLKIHGC